MNNQRNKTQQAQASIVFDRYIKLLLAKKYWILLITLLVSVLWIFVSPKFLKSRQVYTATSIIRFDDPRMEQGASGVEEGYSQTDATVKVGILQTRSFLTKVVDSLKLNINVRKPKNDRLHTIDSVDIYEYDKFGLYELVKNKGDWELFYTNKRKGFNYDPVADFKLDLAENKLSTKYFYIRFKEDVLQNREKIEITFLPTRSIIEDIKNDELDVELIGHRRTMLHITMRSKDQEFVPIVVNTITSLFLEQLLAFKKEKTATVLNSLEEQLELSKDAVEAIEQQVKSFRERNPYVSLRGDVEQFNLEVMNNQNALEAANLRKQQLEKMINEIAVVSAENRNVIYLEVASFLNQNDVPGTNVLYQQYGNILEEWEEMKDQYSLTNPQMQEVNLSIKNQQNKINERANEYLNNLTNQVSTINRQIRQTDVKIRNLPRQEIELAKLEREREAKSSIYSNVLRRYNEAKVAHASVTPDAFLLEEAVVPIVETNILKLLIMLLLGPVFGIALGAGIFIGLDFLSHIARSVEDIEQTLELPVLATIPIIKTKDEIPDQVNLERKIDPKLITIDFSPNYEAEVFRNLRTKLKLKYSEADHGKYVITSLTPGDGKSLVASNLAVTFSQLKKPTLLIDADMRRGVQHNIFLADKKPGLSDILSQVQIVDEESISPYIQKSIIPNLFLLTSGKPVPNPTEIIVGDKIEKLVKVLEKRFNYILIDTPPIEMIADAFILNNFINKMLITVRHSKTELNRMKSKLDEYPEVKKEIIGVVFNGTNEKKKHNYYSYSYYKY